MKKKRIIHNILQEAMVRTKDEKLKTLIGPVIEGLMKSTTQTDITPLRTFNYVDTRALEAKKKIQKNWTAMLWEPPKAGGPALPLVPIRE